MHRSINILFLVAILFSFKGYCQKTSKECLKQLEKTIGRADQYDSEKLASINKLYLDYGEKKNHDAFDHYLKLFEEYAIFNYDSAYTYASKMQMTAMELNDSVRIDYARIKLNFILLSSGMFKEVLDSLSFMKLHHLDNNRKAEYYILMARCYFDLSDYNHDEVFSPRYSREAIRYLDSSLELYPVNSFEYNYYNGLKYIRSGNDSKATLYFKKLMANPNLTAHEIALTTSTYADINFRSGQTDTVIYLLCLAAIADIKTSTKETSAIYNLANLLFRQGDLKYASLFIQKAADDAQFYGARQRMVQLSSIQPLIAGENLSAVEIQKKNIVQYAVIVTALFLLLIVLIIINIRQVRRLESQQKEISQTNNSLQSLLKEQAILLEEKEWLRKEIHHRVKNNLQTVMSLLESQSAFLEKDALMAIRDSQHRVFSMSLIHQKLYQTENVKSLDMAVYIPELVYYLRESFDTKQRIRFELEIASVELDVSQAVPLGLMLTEAITNCIKYAFPGDKAGLINISVEYSGDDHILLKVVDNGIGLPEAFFTIPHTSLGMRLMKGLSEDINAVFAIQSDKGTAVSILFAPLQPFDKYN